MDAKGRQTLFMILTVLLCLAVLATGVILCYGYFARGMNLRAVDMTKYAKVEMEDEVYTVSVDADAIVKDFHLPNPKSTNLDLTRYPDVAAIYSLSFLVTPRAEGGWLIQTGSDRTDPAADLRKGGLKLTDTEWVWTEQDMKNAYRAGLEYPRKLSMKKYVLCGKNTAGSYVLTVDRERLLRATGWDLPADETARQAHTGYKVVMSLGYCITPLATDGTDSTDGFLVETTTNMTENVYSLLLENGVKLTDTTWVYTLDEVEALYDEQHSAQPEDVVPADAPQTEPDVAKPETTQAQGPLTSLYHVDQTPVRTAIREAKTQWYGKTLKSSEVAANFFIAAKTDSAEHTNCFRLVYAITTTAGKEYLVADVYDLTADARPTVSDVKISVKSSASEAVRTVDFDSGFYTVHTLSGGSMVYAEDNGASPFNADGLVFPDSLTEKLTEADLWSLPVPADKTLHQVLQYARNEIFARCGNRFSDTSEYTRFYANYAWYRPIGSVSTEAIKQQYPVAAENIKFIKTMEKLIKEG